MWTQGIDGPIPIAATYTTVTDPDTGQTYQHVATWRPEYHLNAPLSLITGGAINGVDVSAYLITPVTPERIYAGDAAQTAYLRFPDEATAKRVLASCWIEPNLS